MDSEAPEGGTEEDLAEGTLLSHLVELRNRILKAFAAVMIIFVPLMFFNKKIFEIVSAPLRAALDTGQQMIATNPISVVFTPFKLTFIVALCLAMPFVLYQVWAFVAPGLYKKEKRFAFPLLASSIVLFYAGVAFAYFVLFPLVFNFLVAFAPDVIELMPDIAAYVSFVVTISFVFGLAFEVPVATVLIVWTGITTPDKLAKARPYVFLAAFIVGMFLTPPDVFSQTLLAIPVYLLYELGLVMSRVFITNRREEEDEPVAADS
ncbi:MAG: twin-arginine translocase subunit TatC [Woeseiaceae bacterium]|nr:twin-arginine translocase subunit TatC [Woeseiaceae bacterium]